MARIELITLLEISPGTARKDEIVWKI